MSFFSAATAALLMGTAFAAELGQVAACNSALLSRCRVSNAWF